MHKNFAEWYRLVRIEPNGALLKNRWAGVEDWTASLRDKDDAVVETVRLFQGLPEVNSREAFLAACRKHDPAFPQRNNELEQRVLAGAVLVECVLAHGDDPRTLRTAVLAGTALEASRLRVADGPLDELIGEVLDGLHKVARQQRRRRDFDTILLTAAEERVFSTTIATNFPDHNQLRESLATAFQTLLQAVRRSESALTDATHNQRCADEETNILWWLEGAYSRDLDKPWNTLKDEVPLTAGWELADLTDVALGPREVAAFLKRLVSSTSGKSKDQPIHAYVNAVSDDWAKAHATNLPERALDLAPLTLALSQRAKSGTSSWQQYFEKTGGVAPTKLLAPEVAAKQAYVEAVFLRTLAETED
jgi:hypothetical protein